MNDDDATKSDNLSNFARDLQEIEGRDGGVTDPARANEVRESLIRVMGGYVRSLSEFAEQLDRYHKLFKAKKTATVAMERIAAERGCSSRTLYRLLESFKDSQQLPLVFMDALREEGIDPVRGKNHSLVETLTAAPVPATQDEAKASLEAARTKVLKMAPVARKARTLPAAKAPQATGAAEATDTIQTVQTIGTAQFADAEVDEFAANIVRMFEERFGGCEDADRDNRIRSVLERVVNALHVDVRELRIEGRPGRARKPAKKTP